MGALETIEFDLTLDEARRWVWITTGLWQAAAMVLGIVLVLASLVVSVIASAVIAVATVAVAVLQQRTNARVVDVMVRAPHRCVGWDGASVLVEGPATRCELRTGAVTKVERRSGFLIAWHHRQPVVAVPTRVFSDTEAEERLASRLRTLIQAP